MGLEKIAEKLDSYYDRLEHGKATKIKPSHVEKAIVKLNARQEALNRELLEARKPSKKERLQCKLATVRTQIERAEWLLDQIGA